VEKMDEKLKILLLKEEIENKYISSFATTKLKRIVVSPKNKTWTIYLENETMYKKEIIETLEKNKYKLDQNAKEIRFIYQFQKLDKEILLSYYPLVLEFLKEDLKVLELYQDKFILENGVFILKASNKIEYEKLKEILPKMQKYYHNFGYQEDINLELREEKGILEEIHKELDESLKKVITPPKKQEEKVLKKEEVPKRRSGKTEDGAVLGRMFTADIIKIKSLLGEDNDVTVEAYIFATDYFESSKTDFKIITLKITDYSDSIYVKVFTRSDEDYGKLVKSLKVGKWFKIRGYSKIDAFSNKELVLNARDINEVIKEETTKIEDNAPIKRVELHAHTMMSQLDLGKHTCELVERTIDMGYRGVAITDHNGCQAFPISFGIIKGHNKGIRKKIKSRIEELEEKIKVEEDASLKEQLQLELEKAKEEAKNPPIFKGLYGTELTLVDDTVAIVVRPTEDDLLHNTYVVFDTETT